LWESIVQKDQDDALHVFSWLENYVYESRQIDDTGGGYTICKAKWMDVFIPYVPRASRDSSCQGMVMRNVLFLLGDNDNIKVSWTE